MLPYSGELSCSLPQKFLAGASPPGGMETLHARGNTQKMKIKRNANQRVTMGNSCCYIFFRSWATTGKVEESGFGLAILTKQSRCVLLNSYQRSEGNGACLKTRIWCQETSCSIHGSCTNSVTLSYFNATTRLVVFTIRCFFFFCWF